VGDERVAVSLVLVLDNESIVLVVSSLGMEKDERRKIRRSDARRNEGG